jgi:C4-dicarboxylate-specific signal transduction histidine kinase
MAHSNVKFSYDKNTPMFQKTFSLYRVQFSQVLLNLITNSFYAVEELEERWIKVEMEENGKTYNIRVTDSGSGIPKENLEKIFTPFFTTKPVGKGTGLGLPLCHNIMKTCGGDLYYDKSSKNTSFVVVLPPQDFIREYDPQAA